MEKRKNNSVILILGRIHAASSNHDIREFTVRIYNDADMIPHTQGEHNDRNTEGYLETEDLEEVLSNLRSHIQICYHHRKITKSFLEEEST